MNFYPRPPRGGRPLPGRAYGLIYNISIHALREEGDAFFDNSYLFFAISIHALREEGDRRGYRDRPDSVDFYPRPPRGGRRRAVIAAGPRRADFYPRPPRGGRPKVVEPLDAPDKFLSTPSARRATQRKRALYCRTGISIHALREEGDEAVQALDAYNAQFLSTPSARRATI